VLRNLSIKSVFQPIPPDEICMICLEPHDILIKLPCAHYFCLEALLRYYEATRIKEICVYCRRKYKFSSCQSVGL